MTARWEANEAELPRGVPKEDLGNEKAYMWRTLKGTFQRTIRLSGPTTARFFSLRKTLRRIHLWTFFAGGKKKAAS